MVVAKELKTTLGFEERLAIAFSVDYTFTNGSLGNLEWELDMPEYGDYMAIAEQIKEGKTSGDSWNLTLKRYTPLQF